MIHGADQIIGLGQNSGFELRVVADPGIHGGDAFHGRIKEREEFIGNTGGDLCAVAEAERVFVGHDDAAGFLHTGADGVPIAGIESPEIQDFDGDLRVAAFHVERGLQSLLDDSSVGDDGERLAGFCDARFAERDHKTRPGGGGAVIHLAVELLVFEEEHRVIAADGGSEQSCGVFGIGREHDAEAGNVGEVHLAALAVIDGTAVEIAADGDADDHGSGKTAVGAPAERGEFIAELHHGGPDVVKELDFDNRLETRHGHAAGATDDGGFGDGGVEAAAAAEFGL